MFRRVLVPQGSVSLHVELSLFGQYVSDIIPGMSVETLFQPLLVQIMPNETDAATQNKKPIQRANVDELLRFLVGEAATGPHEVDKRDCNHSVDVEDQIGFLGSGDFLHLQSVVQQRMGGELLVDVGLENLGSLVGVVDRLHSVTNTHDQLTLLAHVVHKVVWMNALEKNFVVNLKLARKNLVASKNQVLQF